MAIANGWRRRGPVAGGPSHRLPRLMSCGSRGTDRCPILGVSRHAGSAQNGCHRRRACIGRAVVIRPFKRDPTSRSEKQPEDPNSNIAVSADFGDEMDRRSG